MSAVFAPRRYVLHAFALLLVVAAAGGGYYYWSHRAHADSAQYKTPEEAQDVYVRFDMEAYDQIETNYWQQANDSQFAQLFQAALQKAAASSSYTLATTTRAGVAAMLEAAMSAATSTDAKKNLVLNTLIVALYNLAPNGRSGLLSQQQEVALRQEVSNVNPNKNLYQDLGAQDGASQAQVEQAYQEKVKALEASTSSTAKQELVAAQYAHKVLADANTKAQYDQAKVEPTAFGHVLGHTLYFSLTKISPTTLREFALAVDQASTTPGLDSMILDVRGNIGGALDFLQGFLGLFIGQNQYAFDLFHQGNYEVQRTTLGTFNELSRFTDIAILTDQMTQSTAELMAATFKRYHLAHVVGTTTRGWGTVENTYPLATQIDPSTSYALLLVNSITLRDDGQPIEGHGVDPDVNIADKNWQGELSTYLHSASLIEALKQEATKPPLQ